jgi:hypothetical protein
MSTSPDTILSALLETSGLTLESRLFRATLREYLSEDSAGNTVISADPAAGEALDDIYNDDHGTVAEDVGAGLAFAESADSWADDDRVVVEVRLGDALDQGARVYPVTSVITETVWFLTLPAGHVRVRTVS